MQCEQGTTAAGPTPAHKRNCCKSSTCRALDLRTATVTLLLQASFFITHRVCSSNDAKKHGILQLLHTLKLPALEEHC